jgi:hypothetical protein
LVEPAGSLDTRSVFSPKSTNSSESCLDDQIPFGTPLQPPITLNNDFLMKKNMAGSPQFMTLASFCMFAAGTWMAGRNSFNPWATQFATSLGYLLFSGLAVLAWGAVYR